MFFKKFDSQSRGQAGPGSPTLDARSSSPFYDYHADLPSRGIANRYIWTATGGLHAETEQFSAVHELTYTGQYDHTHLTGITGDFELTYPVGVYGGIDLLFGGQIKIEVGKTEADSHAFALSVGNACDPMLQGYDASTGTHTAGPCPGKVDAYRFMTFYLPPSADNGDVFLNRVVDQTWLAFSSDPNAVALRGARLGGQSAWRVLHRVTYVSRVPPAFDTNPAQTVAHSPQLAIDVEDNPFLAELVAEQLGRRAATPAAIGAAVAAVLAPTDGTSPSVLGRLVPWWADFLAATRKPKRDPAAVALLNQILDDTVAYMQAGYATGVLPLPAAGGPPRRAGRSGSTRARPARTGRHGTDGVPAQAGRPA